MNNLKKIIEEICNENKINYQYISDNYVMVLEKNGKYRYIYNNLIGINSMISGKIVDDKYAMYEILNLHHIPVVKYDLVWCNQNKENKLEINKTIKYLIEYFNNNNKHIVLKPNNGYAGINVFNIQTIKDLKDNFLKLLNYTDAIVVNPFYKIKNEHRIIILNNEIRLMYTKNLSNNNWQFNLSYGNYVTKITDEKLKKELSKLSLKVYSLLNSKFVSIDIIEDYNHNLYVLEVNGSVTINKYLEQMPNDYNIVKKIYWDAIEELFKN